RFLTRVGLLSALTLFAVGLLNEPNRMPYLLFMVSFWFLIRVASMTVTPFGIPEGSLPEYSEIKDLDSFLDFINTGLNTQNVLFFSGHTGFPLLGFLLFRRKLFCSYLVWPMALITAFYIGKYGEYPAWLAAVLALCWSLILIFRNQLISLRAIFLIWSFIMAVSVLLIRSHYSLDILGAYFMTPGIYLIGQSIFQKIDTLCDKINEVFDNEE
ncbi:MAG: hypothetical protein AAB646_02825, partial [Patescibacteria group bacterium]